jgi:hypothetical protein
MEENEAYKRAEKRVEDKLGFYTHAAVYVVVNIFLAVLNLLTSPDHKWFVWPLFGWGIGLLFHGVGVFISGESSMKERMIERELKRNRRSGE